MQPVSSTLTQRITQQKAQQVNIVRSIDAIAHKESIDRRNDIYFWIVLVGVLLVTGLVFMYTRMHALTVQYHDAYKWWRTRFRDGPRPHGTSYMSLTCVCLSAEYVDYAHMVCQTCPQTSAIFILAMVQHFGSHMTGIHYSGDRTQLHGDKFRAFISSWNAWNVPTNPWHFLWTSHTSFDLSAAIRRARNMHDGSSMLESLYNGGLCACALQHYKPDVDAHTMLRMLLDEEIVYVQPCGWSRLSKALENGSNVGTAAGTLYALKPVGEAIARRAIVKSAAKAATTSLVESAATDSAEAGTQLTIVEGVDAAANVGDGEVLDVASQPFVLSEVAVQFVVEVGISMAISVGTTAVATAAFYATSKCPNESYTLVMQPDGTYKKVAYTPPKDSK